MRIPFFDTERIHQNYYHLLEEACIQTLKKGDFINGVAVKLFSKRLAEYLKIDFVIPCANGSDALTIALQSLNLEKNAEVIIPSFNYVSAAESTQLLRLKPVFCDVDSYTFNTNLAFIKEKISSKTKAIIVTHLFGKGIHDIQEITAFCRENQLFLIEDNAQSLGAKVKNQFVGTFGDISTTSFFPTKNLACAGDGGAIFTSNENLANRLQSIANHGQNEKYFFDFCGYNSRLDTIQAAILNVKIDFLDEQIELRKQNANQYLTELKSIKNIS
jgi:UDP-2-acetamido-2-deoxy-ribo-hexuluronate aminotransferase